MKLTRKLSAILLACLCIFSFIVPAFASDEQADNSRKFTTDKAISTALSAAKAKYAIEGVPSAATQNAAVTKVKYDKNSGSYEVIVRAQNIYKYTCIISVKNFLGNELGIPEDSDYEQQGKISAFFAKAGEKISYFFIRLFNQDEPTE